MGSNPMDAFSPPERNRQKHQECQQVEHHHQTNHSWELVTFILRLLAVWLGGRCVATAKADPLAGRIRRGRKLLDEIVHPALDLPDVAFHRVHPPLEVADPLHLVQPVQQHLAKDSRRPLTETRPLNRLDPIANGNDNVKIIKGYLLNLCLSLDGTMGSGMCKFCTKPLRPKP